MPKNILYFDQENDACEAFHYRGCSRPQRDVNGGDKETQCPLQEERRTELDSEKTEMKSEPMRGADKMRNRRVLREMVPTL